MSISMWKYRCAKALHGNHSMMQCYWNVFYSVCRILYPYCILICTVIDTDECVSGEHNCDQNCHNNEGSYTCTCEDGYTLSNDGKTCVGVYNIVQF